MTRTRKIVLLAIGLLLVLVLIWALRPAPVAVSVAVAERGPLVESIREEGRTRLRDTYTVSAPIDGYLHRVALEPGDEVSAGDVVFELEPPPAPALDARSQTQAREDLAAARARLEAARAARDNRISELELAEREYQRVARLHERELVPESELDRAATALERNRTALAAAEAAVEAARYEVENARAVLDVAEGARSEEDDRRLRVAAPVSGTVLDRQRCCEGVIRAGEAVLEIGALDELEVQVDLLSMDAVRVSPGMPVRIEHWGGERVLEGEVRRVEPSGFMRVSALGVEEQRVPVRVRLTSPREHWKGLGAGYRVEARFILWQGEDVLQIPASALFRAGEGWQVFRIDDGRIRRQAVEPGRRSGLMREIRSGLSAGDRVVSHPSDRLEDGLRVTLEEN
jgi:HlyD family secretion protein